MIAALPTDEWTDYVANGQAFTAEDAIAPGGGLVGHVQLFNPVGSGRRVRVRYIEVLGLFGAAINNNLRRYDTALTTLGPLYGPANLLGGGVAPVAELRTQANGAALGSAFWLVLAPVLVTANYPLQAESWAQELLPGQGIVVTGGPGVWVGGIFQWAEVAL